MYEVKNKVALVTGGLGGIGKAYVRHLFKNHAKGIAIVDLFEENIAKKFQNELENEFGNCNVIYIKIDVSKKEELQDAFEKTINHFDQLDIIINNAGICNESNFEKAISVNLNSVVYGINLAREYLPKYMKDKEGVVVITSSIAGMIPFKVFPIYGATKAAVSMLGRCYGTDDFYAQKPIRFLTICPGQTDTPIIQTAKAADGMEREYKQILETWPKQCADVLGECLISIVEEGKNGSIWIVNNGKFLEANYKEIDSIILNQVHSL